MLYEYCRLNLHSGSHKTTADVFFLFVCLFFFLLVERDAVILVESTKHSDNISSMHSGASIGKLLP